MEGVAYIPWNIETTWVEGDVSVAATSMKTFDEKDEGFHLEKFTIGKSTGNSHNVSQHLLHGYFSAGKMASNNLISNFKCLKN